MEHTFNVLVEDITFDSYAKPLSKYKQWKSIYREIKLNLLLETDKKIEFEIADIDKYITLDTKDPNIISLKDVCYTINKMIFIINNNKVIKLTLIGKVLDSPNGRILKSLIENQIEVQAKQFLFENILNFTIDTKN